MQNLDPDFVYPTTPRTPPPTYPTESRTPSWTPPRFAGSPWPDPGRSTLRDLSTLIDRGLPQAIESQRRTNLMTGERRAAYELGETVQRSLLETKTMEELREGGVDLIRRGIPYTKGNESYPWNYQWYIQQLAQNNGDRLTSTQKGIREANEFGGAPLGNDILHPSRVVDLPKQRRQGVFDPIREAAIAQGLLRPTNRWREKLKVPHRQRMVAQQSRADLMCLQRWRNSGPDFPEMLAINPNIAPLTTLGGRVRGGYKPYRRTWGRHHFGPYS